MLAWACSCSTATRSPSMVFKERPAPTTRLLSVSLNMSLAEESIALSWSGAPYEEEPSPGWEESLLSSSKFKLISEVLGQIIGRGLAGRFSTL